MGGELWIWNDPVEVQDALAKLREPFPDEVVGKLPREGCYQCGQARKQGNRFATCDRHEYYTRQNPCPECGGSHGSGAIHLDFVGHADLTDRLLSVDPFWSWEPMGIDEQGLPVVVESGSSSKLWIRLTVSGVTRPGVGTADSGKADTEKELIGDALRNASMRFGAALGLWSKSDRLESQIEGETDPEEDNTPVQQAMATAAMRADLMEALSGVKAQIDGKLFESLREQLMGCGLILGSGHVVDPVPVAVLNASWELVEQLKPPASAEPIPRERRTFLKAEVMPLRPEGWSEDQFLRWMCKEATRRDPSKDYDSWRHLQGNPELLEKLLVVVESGTFDEEPF